MTLQKLQPSDDRRQRMQEGVSQLLQWLEDTARVGVLNLDISTSLEQIGSLMVDAKLGSIASRLRRLQSLDRASPDWTSQLLGELSALYVLGYELLQKENLSSQRSLALMHSAGLTFRKQDIKDLPPIQDAWLVMSTAIAHEENLRIRRTWLLGRKTFRLGLLLDFAFGRSRFEEDISMGAHYQGGLHYYPTLFKLRGVLSSEKKHHLMVDSLPGYTDFERFLWQYAKALTQDPWLRRFPACMGAVSVRYQEKPMAIDQNGRALPLSNSDEEVWRLISISGGHPLTIFGEYNGHHLHVLSIHDEGKIRML